MWSRLHSWLDARRQRREAQGLLTELFRSPELLHGTSLKAHHASRWVYISHALNDNAQVTRVRFGILRHPRPYAFSGQSHKVIEYYVYHVLEARLEREKGVNITRQAGKDAD
jgi:hypothetical protein